MNPNDDKVEAIKSWPTPTNRKQIRAFLGTCGYYRKFILNFSEIADPLTRLTSVKNAWKWSNGEQNSFETLKSAISDAPILSHFDYNLPVVIDTDASAYAIGAVLSQLHSDGQERVVAYYSRCLNTPERNYCVTRRELLAILCVLRNWMHYVCGVKVVVRSDHSSLTWLRNFKEPESQLARWLEKLSEFDIDLQYRKGAASGNADGLSRRPCAEDCRYCSNREQKDLMKLASVNFVLGEGIDWESEQEKDLELKKVREWVNSNNFSDWEIISAENSTLKLLWAQKDSLVINEGVLARKFYLPQGIRLQIVVPVHMRDDVVQQCHESGHFGQKRTAEMVAMRYYWPGWQKNVGKLVKQCVPCNKRKAPHKRANLPFKRSQASEPMQPLGMAILGPLPVTPNGNKYLLVVTDYFSKWVEVLPVPNQKAETVAEVLVNAVFSRFGIPSELHTDQGRNFESLLIAELCKRLGIHKTRTTPYRPQSDGQTERFNRTLVDGLAKLCHKHDEWDRFAPIVAMFYRATVYSATGTTPALLMLGKDIRLPVDVAFPPIVDPPDESQESYLKRVEERLRIASEFARQHLLMSWDTMQSNRPVSRTPPPPIDVNREVFVLNPATPKGYCPKLDSLWRGPFQIIEQLSPYLYKIRIGGRRGVQVVHQHHLFQPDDKNAILQ